mmetsp:Transcript_1696/g.1724  ORF Transcript_1696/g.1724 Transcript_1696/m.1724 type:complete len:676 (+) Transcript_1696:115-2142(+)
MGVAAIRRITAPSSNPGAAAQAGRRPPAPPGAVPATSFGTRLGHFLAFCERLIIRHRAAATLLLAYLSFFWRLYDEAAVVAPMSNVMWPSSSGHVLLNPEVIEPLTRSAVLGRVRSGAASSDSSAGSRRQRGAGLRRESAAGQDKELTHEEESTTILEERALVIAATRRDPVQRAQLARDIYAALGNLYSAHGDYYKMLHAMHLALQAAQASIDNQSVASGHIAWGQLELKHYRYYAAGTRFEDALRNESSMVKIRTEALGGLGWSALMQSHLEAAEMHFHGALEAAGVDPMNLSPTSCMARSDGHDSDSVLSLSGLALTWNQQSASTGAAQSAVACAAAIFREIPSELREAHTWNTLGLAWHALGDVRSARRHYKASLRQQLGYQQSALANGTCSGAVDVTSCSHSALLLGLVEFSDGRTASGKGHVEQLLTRTGDISAETAEWLVRFARAHSKLRLPAGDEFMAFLFGRASPSLQSAGSGKFARHLVEYSQALRSLKPPQLKQALAQLRRAKRLLETPGAETSGWTPSDMLALHSVLAATLREAGELEEAVVSCERVLELEKWAASLLMDDEIPNSYTSLMVAHANLGAARLSAAAQDRQRWRAAISDLTEAAHMADLAVAAAVLQEEDERVTSLRAGLRHARRLAHRRGIFDTCPNQLDAFLTGPQCQIQQE